MQLLAENWTDSKRAFSEATRWFVETTAAASTRWDEHALGSWTVRDLVGHTSRALLTVESYLGQKGVDEQVGSPVDYVRLSGGMAGGSDAVAERGRAAGRALGDDPAMAVATIASRVLDIVDVADGADLVAAPVGGMRLDQYLPTRTFELTVHTCDLAGCLGVPLDPPESAALESLAMLAGLAAGSGQAGPLLLAGTGRTGLPPGFTVL